MKGKRMLQGIFGSMGLVPVPPLSFRTLQLGALSVFVIACLLATVAAGRTFPVQGCGGESVDRCEEDACQCDSWRIDLLDGSGRKWGAIVGKSKAAVEAELADGRKFDESWARFTGSSVESDHYNHQRPTEPICLARCPGDAETTMERRQAGLLADEWTSRLQKAAQSVWSVESTPAIDHARNPYGDVGSVLSDYGRALKDARTKLVELRNVLLEDDAGGTFQDVQIAAEALRNCGQEVARAYGALPEGIIPLLVNSPSPEVGAELQRPRHAPSRKNAAENSNGVLDVASSGNAARLGKLLASGADPNAVDPRYGYSALMVGIQHGFRDIVKLLVDHGANVNLQATGDGYTALMFAVLRNDIDTVSYLLEHGADPNSVNSAGVTALGIVADRKLPVAQLIIRNGGR